MKAAVGNHQTLSIMAVRSRPSRDSHDWPLYGNEYGRIKLDNLPLLAQVNWPLTVIEWTLILMRCLHFNNVNRFGIPKQIIF
jgi:hypothetical protein